MLFQKILLAYDGSQGAQRALDITIELARLSQPEVWALAVEERLPHLAATVGEMEEEKAFANHFYEECLEVAAARARQKGINLVPMIRVGHAAHTIIDVANEGNFDVIVLGHSGQSAVWSMFLGTTAEKVSRHVHCHVLLVR